MDYYFAYGSNLHPIRLEDRLGPAEYYSAGELQAAELLFNKSARDGSGKGNIRMVDDISQRVYGAVYSISKTQERLLDKFEALGSGYRKIYQEVVVESGSQLTCFSYQAMPEYTDDAAVPYDWYKHLVLLGAEYQGFPQEYIKELKNTKSVPDKNRKRATQNELLVEKMKGMSIS